MTDQPFQRCVNCAYYRRVPDHEGYGVCVQPESGIYRKAVRGVKYVCPLWVDKLNPPR